MVHVATAQADSAAPTWAEEGLAEWVSIQAHPGQRSEATDDVLARVRGGRAPPPFPPTGSSRSAPATQMAYAEAWLACPSLLTSIPKRGWAGSMPSWLVEAQWTRRASPPPLQLSEAELTAGWRGVSCPLGAVLVTQDAPCRRP